MQCLIYNENYRIQEKGDEMYKRHELRNGIKVVTERIPHFKSVSIGFWFKAGSAYESEAENGLSHFIEHMLFKGTETRTAKEIAETMDSVGGQLNAFTAKECTCFYCRVIDEHLDLGINLLSDMVLHSVLEPVELNKEKGVILEEIYMYEDSPEDIAHDLLAKAFYGTHSLGQPILGNQCNIERFDRDEMFSFFDRFYTPDKFVISVAGNFDENNLIDLIERYFGDWQRKSVNPIENTEILDSCNDVLFKKKDIEQVHLCVGTPGIAMGEDDIYPLMVFNNFFGGGMSSRLFQKIREDHGLAYSVFSYPSTYKAGGMFTIYAGMKPAQLKDVASLIMDEIQLARRHRISQSEFAMAKEQLKGNYILGLESTSSRMTAIGKSQLLLGKTTTPEEVLNKIDSVVLDDVHDVVDRVLDMQRAAVSMVARDDLTGIIENVFRSI
jgi:predicted Zn-dependent peptidase